MKNNIKKIISLVVLETLKRDINVVIEELQADGGGYEFLEENQQSIVDFALDYLELDQDTIDQLQELQDNILDV